MGGQPTRHRKGSRNDRPSRHRFAGQLLSINKKIFKIFKSLFRYDVRKRAFGWPIPGADSRPPQQETNQPIRDPNSSGWGAFVRRARENARPRVINSFAAHGPHLGCGVRDYLGRIIEIRDLPFGRVFRRQNIRRPPRRSVHHRPKQAFGSTPGLARDMRSGAWLDPPLREPIHSDEAQGFCNQRPGAAHASFFIEGVGPREEVVNGEIFQDNSWIRFEARARRCRSPALKTASFSLHDYFVRLRWKPKGETAFRISQTMSGSSITVTLKSSIAPRRASAEKSRYVKAPTIMFFRSAPKPTDSDRS